jgi:hypothetical protein
MRWNRSCLCLCGILMAAVAPLRIHGQSAHPCTAEIDARVAEVDAILAHLRGGTDAAPTESRLRRLRAALVGLRSGPPCAGAANSSGGPIATDWYTTVIDRRGQQGAIAFQCPPLAEGESYGEVWGTDVYTDDSSVCVAAVHAGIITMPQGGRIVVEMAAGRESYVGTVRNGVVSQAYPAWDGSFVVHAPEAAR